jgi:excisionase family DNA binding protein
VGVTLPDDVQTISWAARRLAISTTTAYRLAESGRLPGVFKVGAQWRVSVPRFEQEVHGSALEEWLGSLAQRAALGEEAS